MSASPVGPEIGEGSPYHHVGIVGLGLLGGSLARDLTALGVEVSGWSPAAGERQAALTAGAVARAPDDLDQAMDGVELVVLATPLQATLALLPNVAQAHPTADVMDVASLKAPVARAARVAGILDRWVGAHPMAGGERSGFSASRPGLFRDARVWMVAQEANDDLLERASAFWTGLGGRPASIASDEHDRLMARASHLPQLLSNALARTLQEAGVPFELLGPGGRDMTRLSASSPAMWADLLRHAPEELPEGLDDVADRLRELAGRVRAGDTGALATLMEETASWRNASDGESAA